MPPNAIVIAFNVAEGPCFSLFDRLETTTLDKFRLESGKEARPPARCHNNFPCRSYFVENRKYKAADDILRKHIDCLCRYE